MTSDALVGASIPLVTMFALWAAKSFIRQTIPGPKGEKGDKGEEGIKGENPVVLSARDYKNVLDFVKDDLKDYFMPKDDSMKQFNDIKARLDAKDTSIAVLQEQIRGLTAYVENLDKSVQELR